MRTGNLRHKLSEIDPEYLTADCSVCDLHVSIHVNNRGEFQCAESHRISNGSKHRRAKNKHTLTEIDFKARKAFCKSCGQVEIYIRKGFALCKEASREQTVAYVYGPEATELLRSQKVCQICGTTKNLCVDHDHSLNILRGRLCKNCNTGLGMFADNIERLEAAANYLRRFE